MDKNQADKNFNLKVWAIILRFVQASLALWVGVAISLTIDSFDTRNGESSNWMAWMLVIVAFMWIVWILQRHVHHARIDQQTEHEPINS